MPPGQRDEQWTLHKSPVTTAYPGLCYIADVAGAAMPLNLSCVWGKHLYEHTDQPTKLVVLCFLTLRDLCVF